MLQLAVGRGRQEFLGHQALQLLRGVLRRLQRVLGVLDLSLRHGELRQDAGRHPRHFAGNQRQAAASLLHTLFEISLAGRQGFEQKGPA